jgi:uncharacterized UBP type Zn finger protein
MGQHKNQFCDCFMERVNFDKDHHLKTKKIPENENNTTKTFKATSSQRKSNEQTKMKGENAKVKRKKSQEEQGKSGMETHVRVKTNMTVLCFENPAGRNLCFSNSAISCLLNIPMMRPLFEISRENVVDISLLVELSNLSKGKNFSKSSTAKLRNIVQSKCFEASQWTKSFDDNKQHDSGEFLNSLLEHLWDEENVPTNLRDKLFGGLCQNTLHCECGYTEELQVQYLPDVIPIQISNESIETCFENYFSPEEIKWNCPKCPKSTVRKTSSLITEPGVLILQLMRYKYDDKQQKVIKLQQKVISPSRLILQKGTEYSLHSVINHLGENTQSGHYNLVLFNSEAKKRILLDDSTISYIDDSQEEMKKMSYVCIYLSNKCNT